MSSSTPVTAVFDIGKTNKKFFLFDKNYSVIEEQKTALAETVDDDGDPCEDLERLESWMYEKLHEVDQKKGIQIEALNFSTYGASFVHLDKAGKATAPLYNYLKSYPEKIISEFYEKYDGREEFSLKTASPPMGMLNSGLQLYWLKYQKPEIFEKIETSLHFPQYLSYLFTGKRGSELTSIGCHTGLWNFEKSEYHHWLEEEKLQHLLPGIVPVKKTEESKEKEIGRIGPGIHDSSAALAPYLMGIEEPFMLVSTGTWSITFNPFNSEALTYEELRRDCLCYLDIYGNQVKSSRLFLGSEYDYQKKKIENFFEDQTQTSDMEPDVTLLKQLIQNQSPAKKLQLEKAHSSGPYPQKKPGDWQLTQFSSPKEAYHQLILDLVSIQVTSIDLVQGADEVEKLIVTGGFSQNELFVKLLASFFPDKRVYTSLLPDASALGAAMVVNEKVMASPDNRRDHNDLSELLSLRRVKPMKELEISQYSWKSK